MEKLSCSVEEIAVNVLFPHCYSITVLPLLSHAASHLVPPSTTAFYNGMGIHVTLSEVLTPLLVQLGKTALHEASIKGNTKMVAYMMEQVNPNVDARDVVSRISVSCCTVHVKIEQKVSDGFSLRTSFKEYHVVSHFSQMSL